MHWRAGSEMANQPIVLTKCSCLNGCSILTGKAHEHLSGVRTRPSPPHEHGAGFDEDDLPLDKLTTAKVFRSPDMRRSLDATTGPTRAIRKNTGNTNAMNPSGNGSRRRFSHGSLTRNSTGTVCKGLILAKREKPRSNVARPLKSRPSDVRNL